MIADVAFCGTGCLTGRCRSSQFIGGVICCQRRLGKRRVNLVQAVALHQAAGSGGWGFGRGHKTIPPPEIAVARDQPLAGSQQCPQPPAIGLADDTGLTQSPLQNASARTLHLGRQRFRPVRQRRIV